MDAGKPQNIMDIFTRDEPNTDKKDRHDFDVACLSWCTSNHKITPVLFKYVGEDGEIYTVRDIKVITHYIRPSVYPYQEYDCEAAIGGFLRRFKLLYFTHDSRWVFRI